MNRWPPRERHPIAPSDQIKATAGRRIDNPPPAGQIFHPLVYFFLFNKQNKRNLLVSLIFLATTRLYITLVSEVYSKRNMNYSSFTRSELFTLIRNQKAALLNMTTGSTHPSQEKIKETQADLDNMVTALNSASITTPSIAKKSANYDLAMRQQSLWDAMKQKKKKKKKFYPGIDVNQFITAWNRVYMIYVTPELATYPSLEEEFVKAAQDLLDQGIFQQMVDSKQNTSTFCLVEITPRLMCNVFYCNHLFLTVPQQKGPLKALPILGRLCI